MMDVVATCFPDLLTQEPGRSTIEQLIPTYGKDLLPASAADEYRRLSQSASEALQLS